MNEFFMAKKTRVARVLDIMFDRDQSAIPVKEIFDELGDGEEIKATIFCTVCTGFTEIVEQDGEKLLVISPESGEDKSFEPRMFV